MKSNAFEIAMTFAMNLDQGTSPGTEMDTGSPCVIDRKMPLQSLWVALSFAPSVWT